MNPLRTFTVVMAHAEAQQTFDRHLQYWQRNGSMRMVMCPADSIIRTDYPVLAIGRKSHHGAMANHRFKELLGHLLMLDFDRFIIHEYDSLCVDDVPALDSVRFWGNVWTNTEPHRFMSSHYFHPPLIIPKDSLARLVWSLIQIPDEAELGFWDRLIGLAVDRSNVAFGSYDRIGFSRNTIEPGDIPAAVAARKAGATMFHGVKTEEVLNAIVSA